MINLFKIIGFQQMGYARNNRQDVSRLERLAGWLHQSVKHRHFLTGLVNLSHYITLNK